MQASAQRVRDRPWTGEQSLSSFVIRSSSRSEVLNAFTNNNNNNINIIENSAPKNEFHSHSHTKITLLACVCVCVCVDNVMIV